MKQVHAGTSTTTHHGAIRCKCRHHFFTNATYSLDRKQWGAPADHIQTPSLCCLLFFGLSACLLLSSFSSHPAWPALISDRAAGGCEPLMWTWLCGGGAHISDLTELLFCVLHCISSGVLSYWSLTPCRVTNGRSLTANTGLTVHTFPQTKRQTPPCAYVALHFPLMHWIYSRKSGHTLCFSSSPMRVKSVYESLTFITLYVLSGQLHTPKA